MEGGELEMRRRRAADARTRMYRLAIAAMVVGLLGPVVTGQDGDLYTESDFLTRTRRLTIEGKRAGEGYYRPDGAKLVFQSEREPENPFYQIYVLDLETCDSRRISPGHGKTTCAFFQPGSSLIMYAIILPTSSSSSVPSSIAS